jgi:hypothetical protein
MMNKLNGCHNCKYMEESGHDGLCKRYPPIFHSLDFQGEQVYPLEDGTKGWYWPVVSLEVDPDFAEWCGEFVEWQTGDRT